jgi:hypothetical protein
LASASPLRTTPIFARDSQRISIIKGAKENMSRSAAKENMRS